MTIFWFVLFILLLLIEISTINLVSIWFSIGALVSCCFSLFVPGVNIQVFIFIFVSLMTLLITKPIVKKLRKRNIQRTNLDGIIGNIGIVTEKITSIESGEVKVSGKRWTAISDCSLNIGQKVRILKIDGVKVIVEKAEED